jgi:tetratricopeptide (TPR) repeat protein
MMSNTLVRKDAILVGAPIPWHLDYLRQYSRMKLSALIAMKDDAPELRTDDGQARFDAQSWALVHFLLFGNKGAHAAKLGQYAALVANGTDPDAAFRETLGRPEDFEDDLGIYVSRTLFSFKQLKVDATTKREAFVVRTLGPAEASGIRALFHAAMGRPVEARAAIAEMRKAAPDAPDGFLAEALLLDREDKRDEAVAAFTRAIDGGSTSPYAPYRLAMLLWPPDADREIFARIEKLLGQAISLSNKNADAYSRFAEARSILGTGEPVPFLVQAIKLEPAEADHRLTAARVLWRQRKYDDALTQAKTAMTLARSDEQRQAATKMMAAIEQAKTQAGGGK